MAVKIQRNLFTRHYTLLLYACMGMALPVHGQVPVLLSNAELNTQKLFIEANQEKLIGAYEKAASLYIEVLGYNGENDAAQYELARVYEAMGENDKALNFIDQAIRNNPGNDWYYVMKGDILEGMEEYAAAVNVYEQLIQLNPAQEYFYEHLVDLFERINRPADALRVLDSHERIAGLIPELIFKKVEILNRMGQPEKGVAELEKLLALYPDRIAFLHRLAVQYTQAGDTQHAGETYERILALDPADGKARLGLAAEFKKSGDDLTYLRSVKELMANPAVALDAKILELIPFVEKCAEHPDVPYRAELGGILKGIVAQYPNEAKAHAIYGDFLFSGGDLGSARSEYEKTLSLDKSVFAVWEQLLYLKLEQEDYDGIIVTAEQAMDVFPNQASIYYLQGLAMARKMDFQRAAASLQQALIMSGRKVALQGEILVLLGEVYFESGQKSSAFDALSKALRLMPQDAALLNRYAYLLAVGGESLVRAKELATRSLELAPGHPDTEHTLGWIAFLSGDLQVARTYLEASMGHGGAEDAKVLEHFGDILISQGQTEEAVSYWQRAREKGNTSELLQRKIAERRLID